MLNKVVHGDPTDRPNLLIAHGLYGSARNWGVIAKRLSGDRQVIAVDMRNHGQSPWFDSNSYADMAADLAEVIDGQWDVLGHSMGGKAAMVLASLNPAKVNKLVVADIAPVIYTHTQMGPLQAMRNVDLNITSRSEAKTQLTGLEPGVDDFLLQSLDMKEKRWMLNLDVLAAEMDKIIGFPPSTGLFKVTRCSCPAHVPTTFNQTTALRSKRSSRTPNSPRSPMPATGCTPKTRGRSKLLSRHIWP